jgi:type IV secretion system protein VirD4
MEEDSPRIGRMNDLTQGLAQQVSLDPGYDLGM